MRSSQAVGVRFLLCLGFFCLLSASSCVSPAPKPREEQTLAQALTTFQGQRLAMVLRGWKEPLTANDITALKAFVEEQRGKDWVLVHLGERLLRQNLPDLTRPPEAVEKAEEILLSCVGEMDFPDWSRRTQQLAELGPAVIPVLEELLSSEGYSNARQLAARALGALGDRSVVPFLRDRAEKESIREVRCGLLRTLLVLEPTKENVEFAAGVVADSIKRPADPGKRTPSRSRRIDELRWSLACFPRDELPTETQGELVLALHAKLDPEDQFPTIQALGQLDPPGAYAVLADLARHEAQAVQQREYTHFWHAIAALSQLKRSDPTPVLLELAPTAPLGAFSPGLVRLVRDQRKEAIPVLQARQKETAEQLQRLVVGSDAKLAKLARDTALLGIHQDAAAAGSMRDRFQEAVSKADAEKAKLRQDEVRLAGALAGLGVDYDRNAALVRDNLTDPDCTWAAFGVVVLLKDEKTVALLCHIIETEETPPVEDLEGRVRMERLEYLDGLLGSAIRAVAEMGAPEAHDALLKALQKGGVRLCDPVGQALSSIGKKSNSPDLELEGEDIIAVGQAYGQFREPRARATMAGSREAERDRKLRDRAKEARERRPYLRDWLPPKAVSRPSSHDLLFRDIEKARPPTVVPAQPPGNGKEPGQGSDEPGEDR